MISRILNSLLLQRLLAAVLVIVAVPAIVAVGAVADEQPIRTGEPAPRTVFADTEVRIVDDDATDNARRTAAASVEPVVVFDRDAQGAIVRDVRAVFAAVDDVRQPVAGEDEDAQPRAPGRSEQLQRLEEQQPNLQGPIAERLVRLTSSELELVERETVAMAQQLARARVSDEEFGIFLAEQLPAELAVRAFPGDTGETIAAPLVESLMRPTVTVDPDATDAARDRAAEAVPEVAEVWRAGEAIVREGELVDPMALRAIERLGLTGSTPLLTILKAALAMLLATAVVGVYLSRMQPKVWRAGQRLILLSMLVVAYAVFVTGSSLLVGIGSSGWAYVAPAGALAMLTALLVHPVVGIAMMLPAVVIVLLVVPAAWPVALFAAAAVLVSVPLVIGIGSRSDLRSATLRAALSYPVLAAVVVLVFGPREELLVVLGAGAANGVFTVFAVQGALPFLETLFRLPTVTALLDLADRNHPLLRELESKALGSYNHSVMVASLTERACRAVGANPLLGSVAALYHDIGKVRQPHFFIENQQGIANPHDELEPEVSAVIIQNHVVDGVELAREYKLPPEVVACIGSHHGTMLVGYFYEEAVRRSGGDPSNVDEQHYRYKGTRPRSKEAALLLLADCCEATTRAMAMSRGTIPREEIEATVARLLQERIDDDQFGASDLTFRELRIARDTIVESLVGIYHPRIAYPPRTRPAGDEPVGAVEAEAQAQPVGSEAAVPPGDHATHGPPDVPSTDPEPARPPR